MMSEAEAAEEEERKAIMSFLLKTTIDVLSLATPNPMDIVEIDAIKALFDAGQVVIACGGGIGIATR